MKTLVLICPPEIESLEDIPIESSLRKSEEDSQKEQDLQIFQLASQIQVSLKSLRLPLFQHVLPFDENVDSTRHEKILQGMLDQCRLPFTVESEAAIQEGTDKPTSRISKLRSKFLSLVKKKPKECPHRKTDFSGHFVHRLALMAEDTTTLAMVNDKEFSALLERFEKGHQILGSELDRNSLERVFNVKYVPGAKAVILQIDENGLKLAKSKRHDEPKMFVLKSDISVLTSHNTVISVIDHMLTHP